MRAAEQTQLKAMIARIDYTMHAMDGLINYSQLQLLIPTSECKALWGEPEEVQSSDCVSDACMKQ